MDGWLWNWSGASFGYREDDALFTSDGLHVGRFVQDEVYGRDGRYLGEVMDGDRLITDASKKAERQLGFIPEMRRVPEVNRVGYVSNVLYVGYEDFPSRQAFE